ncbi:hypothetical protein [Micromonospora craniellae]|uniref:hypothetical protein n=1 Tax=Micromonospora craniellae TaxID=2294034 RepID=UPI0018F129E7|nr:hypothetical protein [Micromonospora craniellae]
MAGRRAHRAHPDLYDGATFGTVDEGVAHAESIGFGEIIRRGTAAAEALPERIVYAGCSRGNLPADIDGAELYLYPGAGHLFADAGGVDYDEPAAELLIGRTLDFLARLG